MLKVLFKSPKKGIKKSTSIIITAFAAYQSWELLSFIKNEHGKSFTIGWFALGYFFMLSFTILAIVCWVLTLLEKRR